MPCFFHGYGYRPIAVPSAICRKTPDGSVELADAKIYPATLPPGAVSVQVATSQLCDMQCMALLSSIPSLPETKTPVLLLDYHVLLAVLARAPASIVASYGYRAYSMREAFCLWRDS